MVWAMCYISESVCTWCRLCAVSVCFGGDRATLERHTMKLMFKDNFVCHYSKIQTFVYDCNVLSLEHNPDIFFVTVTSCKHFVCHCM